MADGVLLIIDAQREYTDGLLPLAGVAAGGRGVGRAAGEGAQRRCAGRACAPSAEGKAFNPSSTGYEIVKPLTPRDGETIVDKGLPNAFAGTELAKHLAASGRKNLIVGGFMTHMCVSATVRSATDHGFMSTIAADTVATRDLPDATGDATVDAADINRITLAALSDRFAWIVPKASRFAELRSVRGMASTARWRDALPVR